MKKLVNVLILSLMVLLLPVSYAYVTQGTGITITYTTEAFEPVIWSCGDWIMTDDPLETGRVSNVGQNLVERENSYMFAGEQLSWKVLVLDKNGIDKVQDVYVSVDGEIQANCGLDHIVLPEEQIDADCNARLGEEIFYTPPGSSVMAYYNCVFTAEPKTSMYGNLPVTATVDDLSGKSDSTDETLWYFFNPTISLAMNGAINFGQNVRPGTAAYSPTVSVESTSEGGVRLDMFIVGTDFYDPAYSGAKCPTTNLLSLSNINYYVTHGAYSSHDDTRSDIEGYLPINYCEGAECNFARSFYNNNEILQANKDNPYWLANILTPGDNMAMTFRLMLPVPCNGNFKDGSIYLMGEAI